MAITLQIMMWNRSMHLKNVIVEIRMPVKNNDYMPLWSIQLLVIFVSNDRLLQALRFGLPCAV
jgi:hypothetical protein